ncbi:MAG: hypothetical protein ACLGHX_00975 [Acidimicrobiia bacterium]
MSSWTAPEFMDELATAVAARSGITALTPKVRVLTYWPSADESITDALILYAAEDTAEHTVMNPSTKPQDEEVNVEGEIRVARAGAGSTVAKACRDRAMTILNELDAQLRTAPPAVGQQTLRARLAGRRMDQFPSESGNAPVRVCLVNFTISYRARTTT